MEMEPSVRTMPPMNDGISKRRHGLPGSGAGVLVGAAVLVVVDGVVFGAGVVVVVVVLVVVDVVVGAGVVFGVVVVGGGVVVDVVGGVEGGVTGPGATVVVVAGPAVVAGGSVVFGTSVTTSGLSVATNEATQRNAILITASGEFQPIVFNHSNTKAVTKNVNFFFSEIILCKI